MTPDLPKMKSELAGLPRGMSARIDAPDLLAIINRLLRDEDRIARLESAIRESLVLSGYTEFEPHEAELVLVRALVAR